MVVKVWDVAAGRRDLSACTAGSKQREARWAGAVEGAVCASFALPTPLPLPPSLPPFPPGPISDFV